MTNSYLFGAASEYTGLLVGAYSVANYFSEGLNFNSIAGGAFGVVAYASGKTLQFLVQETTAELRNSHETLESKGSVEDKLE